MRIIIGIIICLAFLSSTTVIAAPFDPTGIVDLKNEGTLRGSCQAIGDRLQLATDRIWSRMIQRPVARDQDQAWKNEQEALKIRQFGERGEIIAKQLSSNEYVPPSQRSDFNNERWTAGRRFVDAIARDPNLGIQAWIYCAKAYNF